MLKQPSGRHKDDTAESAEREHPSSILPEVMWRDGRDQVCDLEHKAQEWLWNINQVQNTTFAESTKTVIQGGGVCVRASF